MIKPSCECHNIGSNSQLMFLVPATAHQLFRHDSSKCWQVEQCQLTCKILWSHPQRIKHNWIITLDWSVAWEALWLAVRCSTEWKGAEIRVVAVIFLNNTLLDCKGTAAYIMLNYKYWMLCEVCQILHIKHSFVLKTPQTNEMLRKANKSCRLSLNPR